VAQEGQARQQQAGKQREADKRKDRERQREAEKWKLEKHLERQRAEGHRSDRGAGGPGKAVTSKDAKRGTYVEIQSEAEK
jgi:hypothetical protein